VFQCPEGLPSGFVPPLLPAKGKAIGIYLRKELLKLFESTYFSPPFFVI
jgi:hypothetical protein